MTTAYTTNLGLALPVTGELAGTWGDTVNNFLTQYLDAAISGAQTISGTQTAVTLATSTGTSLVQAGSGSVGSSQYQILNCTGSPASALTITAPSTSKVFLVLNSTSTSQTVTVKAAATTGVTVASGRAALIAWNGSDFTLIATNDITKLSGILPVSNGGTGVATITGLVKGNGTSAFTAAVSGTDYAPATTGTSILKGNGSGGFNNAVSGTDYAPATATTSILKGNGSGGFNAAVSGTDYAHATSGTSILYGNGSGGFSNVTIGSNLTFSGGTLSASGGSGGTVTAVTASSPLASSGGTTPNVSLTGIVPTANGGTGNANGTVASVVTSSFSILESGGKLVFKYGATVIASMDSSGNITAIGNVVAGGTP